ncbi:MAG TPA: mechanosensitive ion channel domain-containing protein [Flavisolibacter sp.]|nr:mechanosensitive ion channel domain-containing protein [Flavisolibacter sp.]
MNSFLDRIFLGNTVEDYLWTFGIILFIIVLNRVISKGLAIASYRIFQKRSKLFDQQRFADLIVKPLGIFLIITVSIIAFYRLEYPPEINFRIYRYPLQQVLLSIAIAIQILAFTWVLMRIVDYIAGVLHIKANVSLKRNEVQLIVFFRDFIKVLVGIIGVLLVLNKALNYNLGSLITGLSIVGAALALALRESLENLIASFVIFFDKPFTTGDFVRVQNVSGEIEKIGLRSTRVRTIDKSYVTVPNKQMVDSILDNVSLRSKIRGEIIIHLDLGTPPAKIKEFQNAIKEYLETVKELDTYHVLFNDIKSQGFVMNIEFFMAPIEWNRFTEIKEQINYFILSKAEALDITLK